MQDKAVSSLLIGIAPTDKVIAEYWVKEGD
jgi:hypothetical protein